MVSLILTAATSLFSGWIDVKKAKQTAEANKALRVIDGEFDYDMMAMEAAKTSWKDEMLMMIWFSPLVIGWYDKDTGGLVSATEWVEFVGKLPYWWQVGAFGIMASSFGLRWFFKQQNFKVMK
jgi:hypothetical protein|tara:strand:- start:1452 stop:1820 length:369 start_codon:yes stop_codon:yes gene_type:complete